METFLDNYYKPILTTIFILLILNFFLPWITIDVGIVKKDLSLLNFLFLSSDETLQEIFKEKAFALLILPLIYIFSLLFLLYGFRNKTSVAISGTLLLIISIGTIGYLEVIKSYISQHGISGMITSTIISYVFNYGIAIYLSMVLGILLIFIGIKSEANNSDKHYKKHKKQGPNIPPRIMKKMLIIIGIICATFAVLNIPIKEKYYVKEPYTEYETVKIPYTEKEYFKWEVDYQSLGSDIINSEFGLKDEEFEGNFYKYWGWAGGIGPSGEHTYDSLIARTKIYVPRDMEVVFEVGSDDGSKLFVDGKLVIDNWGCHSFKTQTTSVYLTKGWHELTLYYYQCVWSAKLSFKTNEEVISKLVTKYRTEKRAVTKYRTVEKERTVTLWEILARG